MKTRFAPSPTGMMHIGGVRTALFSWLAAQNQDGQFLLRIEDTDRARLVEGSEQQIKDSLSWLGISWDEEPVRQSERLEIYKKYAQKLIDSGHAYADPYSKEEVDSFREQAKQEKRAFLYRNHRPENPPEWDGSTPLRFKVPEIKSYEWEDLVRGKLSAGPEALDDFVILKAADEEGNHYPTYNFAHIVDDHETGITHVIRGEEFIASTPKFLALYEALDIERPELVTVPPILGPEGGKKLSKRDGAKSILEYNQEHYLPEAVMNFLASLGWNDGTDNEVFSKQELIEKFDLKRIQKSPARFDETKLNWLNWQHVLRLIESDQQQLKTLLDSMGVNYNPDNLDPVSKLAATKSRDTENFVSQLSIFFGDVKVDLNSVNLDKIDPELKTDQARELLAQLKEIVSKSDFDAESIETSLRSFIDENSLQPRTVLMLLRDVLTGQNVSPSIFETMELLGKEEVLKRIDYSLDS